MNLLDKEFCIIIRYSDNFGENTIKEHKKLIDKKGYCWFGKIGKKPSEKYIKLLVEQTSPKIVLYSKMNTYICNIEDISYDKPKSGYPKYYDQKLYQYDQLVIPSVYFKLKNIEKIDDEELNNFIVMSSGNSALQTFNNSMNTMLYCKYSKQ